MVPALPTHLATVTLLSVFALVPGAANRDILQLGSSLTVEAYQTEILQSSDSTFSCGFYSAYTNAFTFSIWFSKAADKTVVWSANRDRPVHVRRSALTLRKDGNMVLTDYDGSVVWQANDNLRNVQHAQLLDTGNIIMEDTSAIFVVKVSFITFAWFFVLRRELRPSEIWAAEEGYKVMTSHFRRYSYRELLKATREFKVELGRGSSGVVYKGVLEDERPVAVKVLESIKSRGKEEFQAKLSVMGRIYHMNLVRIWGFCSEGSHRLLVWEYVENGSLANSLFHNRNNIALDWKQRFNIALGVAKGLAYLHHECLEWVIHCDVKPENILLDQNFEPKITDFGLAKLLNRGVSSQNISHVRGTIGYIAPPKWVSGLPITAKVEVYSYGVVLLELLAGARVSELAVGLDAEVDRLLRKLVSVLANELEGNEESRIDKFVDCRLSGQFSHVQARAFIKLAVSCLEEDRSKRPTMESIVQTLLSSDEASSY